MKRQNTSSGRPAAEHRSSVPAPTCMKKIEEADPNKKRLFVSGPWAGLGLADWGGILSTYSCFLKRRTVFFFLRFCLEPASLLFFVFAIRQLVRFFIFYFLSSIVILHCYSSECFLSNK